MRATHFHSLSSFLFRLGKWSLLCCFFVFFLFRNEFAYIIEQVIESTHLSVNYELWDNDLSSETEIEKEKQEVILSDIFVEHLTSSVSVEEQLIKNPITSQDNVLSVYLEVLSPPPWRAV